MNKANSTGNDIPPVPRGIEVLVKKAAVDPDFKGRLHELRSGAAAIIGLALQPAEKMILDQIPGPQLDAIIAKTRIPKEHLNIFRGRAAALMLAAIGATGIELFAEAGCEGIRPENPRRMSQVITSPQSEETSRLLSSRKISQLIYRGRFETASERFSEVEGADQHPDIVKILQELVACDQLIVDSYQGDIGKEIVIRASSGPMNGSVVSVAASSFNFRRDLDGVEVELKLTPRMLSGTEIMSRLEPVVSPEAKSIYCAVICLERKKVTTAKAFLEKAGVLADPLLGCLYAEHPKLKPRRARPEAREYDDSFGIDVH